MNFPSETTRDAICVTGSPCSESESRPPRSYLVTGGAGFIGSHTCRALLERGDRVAIVDEFNNYYDPRIKRANVAALLDEFGEERVVVFEGDIADEEFLDRAFQSARPHAVCHLAARAGVRPSLEDPQLYVHANVRGTVAVLEAARKHGVRHLVLASSSSVYGANAKIPFSEADRVDGPCSQYAATKRALELLAATYTHLYGMSTTALRFFTVYGPSGRPDMAPFKFIDRIARGVPIDQYGDGSSSRDYTFVTDIVDGVVRALDRPLGHAVLNLGGGRPTVLRDFIGIIAREVGREPVVRVLPEQPGDVPRTFADVDLARRLLGYCPRVPVEEGIRRTVLWYKAFYAAELAEGGATPRREAAASSPAHRPPPVPHVPSAPSIVSMPAASQWDADSEAAGDCTPSPISAAGTTAPTPSRHGASAGAGTGAGAGVGAGIEGVRGAGSSDGGDSGTDGSQLLSPTTVSDDGDGEADLPEPPRAGLALCTRIHGQPSLDAQASARLEAFLTAGASAAEHVAVAVEAGGGLEAGVRAVVAAVERGEAALRGRLHVLPVAPWEGFTGPLNALVRRASSLGCDLVGFQSLELAASAGAVSLLCDAVAAGEDVLVAGAALPGHDMGAGAEEGRLAAAREVPLSGTTVPWNTLAVWRVRSLALVGFPLVADGVGPVARADAGVEEAAAVAVAQRLLGARRARALLVRLPRAQVTWSTSWKDPERARKHKAKMESKMARASAQMDALGVCGTVEVVEVC